MSICCGECYSFAKIGKDTDERIVGLCRLNPPVFIGGDEEHNADAWSWPVVCSGDRCSKFNKDRLTYTTSWESYD